MTMKEFKKKTPHLFNYFSSANCMSSTMLSADGRAISPHEAFLMGETKYIVRYRLIRGKEKKQRSVTVS